ncbi:MAG TPA: ribose ABC transporter permease [Clostridiales bacterium]|nr:ribose ABC transporter permease [Clostridiales bacterium]
MSGDKSKNTSFGTKILLGIRPHLMLLAALFLLMIIMSFIAPNFLTKGNMLDIMRVNSIKGIMSIGMTLILLTGGIDLSIGATFAVAGAVAASLIGGGYSDYATSNLIKLPTLIAIIIALMVSAMIGMVNGVVITKLRVEPFIATLAMMTFARGITYLYTGGYPINFKPIPDSFAWFGKGYFLDIPVPALIFIIVVLVGGFVLKYTCYGRSLYAIGGNRETAKLSGIQINKNICRAYIVMAVLSGLAGIIMTSRVASASAVAGEGYEMDVIASVVLGGTSLAGGKGTIIGTVIGIFILGVIENGLNILGIPTYFKIIIKGLIIILALGYHAFSHTSKKRKVTV